MPVRRKDAQRALVLLEAYQTKLSQTDDRQLKHSIQRVIDIFQSNLFQALIDIQEFYEVTLLDSQKCADPARSWEPLPPVNLWDLSSLQSPTGTSETLPSISTSIEDSALLQEIFHALAQGKDHASGPVSTGDGHCWRWRWGGGGGRLHVAVLSIVPFRCHSRREQNGVGS
ncbi:unnamed protein product [Gadus morhua 'NCC']